VDNFSISGFAPRFDAYAASVMADPDELLQAFEDLTPGARFEAMRRAPQGYAFGWRLEDGDGQLGQLWCGGKDHPLPHMSFQGEASPLAAGLLRESFPRHSVSRADVVALDSVDAGAYEALQAQCLAVAGARKVKVGTAGDHLLTFEGRTLYLGAPTSAVRLRLYDKAAELRARLRDPKRLASVPPELARLELQVRPQSKAKERAALASPAELLGAARWMREIMARVGNVELGAFSVRGAWRESDNSRTYWYMLSAYGNTLRRVLEEAGSAECMGKQIAQDLKELEEHEQRGQA
jgi:hypothetical protein